MKIEYHVLSVATLGDRLKIVAQGNVANAAEWRPMSSLEFTINDTETNAKTYHVGRRFSLTVKPL
jgi:hypothetical protein